MKEVIKTQITIKNALILIGLVSLIFLGRSTVTKNTEIKSLNNYNDSLSIELRDVKKRVQILDSINFMWEYEVDSLRSNNKVVSIRTKRKKKERYESTQKMSLDSAVVARNILLDSAINAQRGVREAESNSDN